MNEIVHPAVDLPIQVDGLQLIVNERYIPTLNEFRK